MIRIDHLLASKGIAKSRTHAQDLIKSERVYIVMDNIKHLVKKSSLLVSHNADIFIKPSAGDEFVSRAGIKLNGALTEIQLNVEGMNVLDIGCSTGGFSDCLLKRSAQFVLGVDVGHNQIDPSLIANPHFKLIEGLNARDLTKNVEFLAEIQNHPLQLVVMDVSFISIHLIIPEISKILAKDGLLLSLVKPQFEVGPQNLKDGIVKEPHLFKDVENKIVSCLNSSDFQVISYFSSSIEGKDGNKEFFVFAKKV